MPLSERLQKLASVLSDAISCSSIQRVFVAYSGGKDSELLAALVSWWYQQTPSKPCHLLHVNHGLSDFAADWALHCQKSAERYRLPIEVIHVEPKLGPRISVEAAAREARYQAFAERLGADDVLLTAHHQDDQVETLLLALKRGSGPLGLSGMRADQPLGQGRLLRPWLEVAQSDIKAGIAELSLDHIDDDSNSDNRYDRNFVRNRLLPIMNERWPGVSSAIARTTELCAEQQQLCDELAQLDLEKWRLACGGLSIEPLLSLREARRNNLLRYWLRQQGALMPSRRQMEAMSALWLARTDGQPELKWSGFCLKRYQDALFLVEDLPLSAVSEHIELGHSVQLLNGECWSFCVAETGPRLTPPKPFQQVWIRYGLPGSTRLKPVGRSGSRTLKKLWQEYRVPPWLRSRVAMLCYDDEVVAALGLWFEQDALCLTGPGVVPNLN